MTPPSHGEPSVTESRNRLPAAQSGALAAPFGTVYWQVTADGIELRQAGQSREAAWRDITAGALVTFDSGIPPDMPRTLLPGMGWLFRTSEELSEGAVQLVLARGQRYGRALRVSLPADTSAADELIDCLRRRLGARWCGVVARGDESKVLGLRLPWWQWPLYIGGLVLFGYMLLLAGAAFDALRRGQLAGYRPVRG